MPPNASAQHVHGAWRHGWRCRCVVLGSCKGSAGHKEQEPWLRPGHLCSASDLLSGSGLLGAFLRLPLCAGGQGGASLSAEKVLYTRHQRCATPLRSSHYLGGPVARRAVVPLPL